MYEFKLREGLRFHNGDPCTAEDVKFSFERYRGMGATPLHAHVHAVEVVDALRVRFHLQAPWPNFLTFYGTTAHYGLLKEGFRPPIPLHVLGEAKG